MNPFRIHMLETNQFKDMSVHIRFASENNERKATIQQLLITMMSDRTAKYPTKKDVSNAQDYLYGIRTIGNSQAYGKALVYEQRFVFLNSKFTKDEKFNEDVVAYMEEILFHSTLDEKAFQEAKTILSGKLETILDYPREYVIIEGLKESGHGNPLGIPVIGSKEVLDTLTLSDVIEEFQDLINTAMIDVVICGEDAEIEDMIKEMLIRYIPQRPLEIRESYYVFTPKVDIDKIVREKDIPQANFLITYETGISIMDPLYTALVVGNAILGQYPTSMLFQEVREKRSLCYSISSSLISHHAALIVHSGMEEKNIETALELIDKQAERVRVGDFSDELLETTKVMIKNSIKSNKDSANARVGQVYQQILTGKNMSIDAQLARVNHVDKEMIQEAFQSVRKVQTMILKGSNVDEKSV